MSQYVQKIRTHNGDLPIDYNALANKPTIPALDTALTESDKAANAKTVGDKFSQVNSAISGINENINTITNNINTINDNISTINSTMATKEKVNSLYISNPNLLINGDFQVWQRGSKFSNISNQYTADRWRIENAKTTPTHLVEISYSTPDDQPMRQSIHIHESGTENTYLKYYFDSALRGTLTLSFWYKTDRSFSVSIYDNGSPLELPDATVSTSTWTRYVCSFTASSLTYLNVIHAMSSGDVYITGVKLEYGKPATKFAPKTYQEELEACQNYFQKINLLYKPGVTNNSGAFVSFSCDTKLRSVDGVTPKVTLDVVPAQIRTTAEDTISTTLTFKSASYYRGYLVVDFNSSANIGAKTVAWPISDFKISVEAELKSD